MIEMENVGIYLLVAGMAIAMFALVVMAFSKSILFGVFALGGVLLLAGAVIVDIFGD